MIAYDTFLLFARQMELQIVSLDVPEINNVPVPVMNLTGAVAVETLAETDSIYWSDKFKHSISTAHIDVRIVERYFYAAATECTLTSRG